MWFTDYYGIDRRILILLFATEGLLSLGTLLKYKKLIFHSICVCFSQLSKAEICIAEGEGEVLKWKNKSRMPMHDRRYIYIVEDWRWGARESENCIVILPPPTAIDRKKSYPLVQKFSKSNWNPIRFIDVKYKGGVWYCFECIEQVRARYFC